jgi:hypothetical protein
VFLASISFIELLQSSIGKLYKSAAISIVVIGIVLVTRSMVVLHPYQYIYFNELIGGLRGAYGLYETDYWHAANREALEWLEQYEIGSDKTYYVLTCGDRSGSKFFYSANMKWAEDITRADYYVCFTRWNEHTATSQGEIVHVVERDQTPLIYIRRLR